MRVVHVVLSLNVGGLERGVLNQLREGLKLGQTVSVICVEEFGELADQARATGARLICLDKRPGIRPGTFRQVEQAIRALSPEVVHTHHIAALFYAGPVARRLGVPLVVHTEHGRKDYAGRFRTRMLGRWAARYAQRFYCLTEDMAASVRQNRVAPPHKVKVIFNGIDTAIYSQACDSAPLRQELGIPAGAPVIGTIGRLNEIKRQDVLLRAFAKVLREMPEARLVIVGDGPLRGELRALASELGIAGSTHFAGYRPDTTAFLHAMDVFVLTSRSEGMPQAALEASSAGLPVVATRVGGLPELIDHGRTGLLVPPGDDAAVAEGIRFMLRDRTAARAMGRQAHERVTGMFDVKQMAAVYHRDFLAMLNPNATGADAQAEGRRMGEVRCA